MPKPPPARPRRTRRLVLVLLLCAVAGFGALQWSGARNAGGSGYADLPTVLRGTAFAGWEVVEPPDRPGPYRLSKEIQPVIAPRGQRAMSNFVPAGGKARRIDLQASAEYDQAVVALETEGEKLPTFVVLRHRHIDPPSTAPKPEPPKSEPAKK